MGIPLSIKSVFKYKRATGGNQLIEPTHRNLIRHGDL